jgi:tetratricopeptide (TPR) repeat protein
MLSDLLYTHLAGLCTSLAGLCMPYLMGLRCIWVVWPWPHEASLQPIFLRSTTRLQAADNAWSDAISIDQSNPNTWSNRGTARLQNGRWHDARADLQRALELEASGGSEPSALVLNQLGNAEGAEGEWDLACDHYRQAAAQSLELESIASANLALALCQCRVRVTLHHCIFFMRRCAQRISGFLLAMMQPLALAIHGHLQASSAWAISSAARSHGAERHRGDQSGAESAAQGRRVPRRALCANCLPVGGGRAGCRRAGVEHAAGRSGCAARLCGFVLI